MAGPWEDYTPAPDVASMVTAEAQKQGLDPALALRVANQESGLNHGRVSPAGAVGVMQLMPNTAHDLGVDPTDLAQNISGGVSYLKQQMDTFKDPRLAAAAYNAGAGAVHKYGGVPPYPETQKYVDAVAPGGSASPPWMDYAGSSDQPAQAAPSPASASASQPGPTTGIRNGQMVFADTGDAIPDAQAKTIQGLAHQLDPKAAAGALQRPFVQRKVTDTFKPGQYYIDTSGKLTQVPAQPGVVATALDAAKSGLSGAADGFVGLGDQIVNNVVPGLAAAKQGLQIGQTLSDFLSGSRRPHLQIPTYRDMIAPALHAPQTTAGQYARSVGEMAPAALAPGSVPQRIANVVIPGVTSEGAGQVAGMLGAGPRVQQAARVAGGLIGSAGASLWLNPAAASKAMTLDQVAAAKKLAYDKVDASGFTFPQANVQNLADEIASTVAEKGGPSGARLYPAATAMSDRIGALAQQPDGVPLTQLDSLRSDIYGALVKPADREAPLGVMMRQKIDSLINGSDAPNIQEARDLNTRLSKMQEVTDKLDSAGLRSASTYSGGNYNNAVRQNLRPLVDPTSSQQIGNLSPAEQAALRTAVTGTPAQNATRYASKFLTNKFVQVPASLMTHGIATPVMEALGAILNKSGEAQTGSAVQKVLDLMSRGGTPQPKPAPLMLSNNPHTGMASVLAMLPMLSASPALAQQPQAARPR